MAEVPDVVGMTQSEAEAAITEVGLIYTITTSEEYNEALAGTVLSQNPASWTSLPCGSNVELVISRYVYIEGILHHQGIPMSKITIVEPTFWFRDEVTGQAWPDATAYYDPATGAYSADNLSELCGISISFHTIGDTATLPGNYRTWEVWSSKNGSQYDIEIKKIIHLVEPWNNNSIAVLPPPYPIHYDSPIKFEWESVAGATSYHVYVQRYRDADHTDGYGYIDTLASQDTEATSFTIQLPASEQYEHYEFDVRANKDSSAIGYYMTTYDSGRGWDYRFKIEVYEYYEGQ